MDDEALAIWRAAIKDSGHERHKVAWALFGGIMEGKALARLLEAQREQVIEWALPVLESEVLAEESALGSGYAPINAALLMGEWKVTAAVPALLKIIIDEDEPDDPSLLWNAAVRALSVMPREVLPTMFALAQTVDEHQQMILAAIIADVCDGDADDAIFAWLIGLFEAQIALVRIEYMMEHLIEAADERAVAYLETVYLPKARPKAHADKLRLWIADKRAQIGKKA